MTFRVVTDSAAYSGKWLVVRSDQRLVFESQSVRECLRWVRTWGPTAGHAKRGQDCRRQFA